MKTLVDALKNNPVAGYAILVEYCAHDWEIDSEEICWESLGCGDWMYSGHLPEGYIIQDDYLIANVDLEVGCWVTMIFDKSKGKVV